MRTLLFMCVVTGSAYAANPNVDAGQIRGLIEKLAISDAKASPNPVYTPSKDTPKTDRRVIAFEAAKQLREMGITAFPSLLASLDDERQSVAFRRVLPSTVGDACFCIITEQLYSLPNNYPGSFYRTGADGKMHERPVFLNHLFTYSMLKKWMAAREGRTLPELQLETLAWVLGEEERIGAANDKDEAKYLAPLRAHYKALQVRAYRPTTK